LAFYEITTVGKVEGGFLRAESSVGATLLYGVEGVLEFATAAAEIGTKKEAEMMLYVTHV